MAKVYIHLFPNGKRYVGITTQSLSHRWGRGSGYHKNTQTRVRNAIDKYGWDNIQHILFIDNISFEEAKKIEKELIKKYHTKDKKFGYNGTDGGDGVTGRIITEEQRKKASIKQKEVFKRLGSYVSYPVHQYDLNGNYIASFASAREAERKTGIGFRSISMCLTGRRKSTHGYVWSKNKALKIKTKITNHTTYCHKIYQYDSNYNLIKSYKTAREAAKINNISYKAISNSVRRGNKSGRYFWSYIKK